MSSTRFHTNIYSKKKGGRKELWFVHNELQPSQVWWKPVKTQSINLKSIKFSNNERMFME